MNSKVGIIRLFAEKAGFDCSEADLLCCEAEKISDDGFINCQRLSEKYKNEKYLDVEAFEDTISKVKSSGVSIYTLRLLLFIVLAPELQNKYRAAGIGDKIFYNTIFDLKIKSDFCKKQYGVLGNDCPEWEIEIFNLKIFGLGRLDFALRKADFSIDGKIDYGDSLINVHIPSSGPLVKDECEKAYRLAADFFKRYFGIKKPIFFCSSWLLYPELKNMLTPTSNILKFSSDYIIISQREDKSNENLQRIFGVSAMPKDPDSLPSDTSLQRAFIKHFKSGGNICIGVGVYFFD